MKNPPNYSRSLIVIAIFTVLSTAGGLIKFGTPVGSIALDSWPGFFVAAYYSPFLGFIVAVLGHLGSAASAGFPLQLLHLAIALMQGVWAITFGEIIRRIDRTWAVVVACIVAALLNGIAAPWLLSLMKPEMKGLFMSLIGFLLVASSINVLAAGIAVFFLARSKAAGL